MFEVRVQQFSGPIEKLVELIEEKKMDITTISLASVTADFLNYISSIKSALESRAEAEQRTELSRILADFLVVASHLVLIKSKSLIPELPTSEEEDEGIVDLEKRLKLYAEVKPLFLIMKERWHPAPQMWGRELFKDIPPVFYPPAQLSAEDLRSSLAHLLNLLGSVFKEQEKVERQIITLEEKIEDVFKKVSQGIQKFSHFITQKSKEESIVIFLALLHLLRDRMVRVEQNELYGEISVEKSSQEG